MEPDPPAAEQRGQPLYLGNDADPGTREWGLYIRQMAERVVADTATTTPDVYRTKRARRPLVDRIVRHFGRRAIYVPSCGNAADTSWRRPPSRGGPDPNYRPATPAEFAGKTDIRLGVCFRALRQRRAQRSIIISISIIYMDDDEDEGTKLWNAYMERAVARHVSHKHADEGRRVESQRRAERDVLEHFRNHVFYLSDVAATGTQSPHRHRATERAVRSRTISTLQSIVAGLACVKAEVVEFVRQAFFESGVTLELSCHSPCAIVWNLVLEIFLQEERQVVPSCVKLYSTAKSAAFSAALSKKGECGCLPLHRAACTSSKIILEFIHQGFPSAIHVPDKDGMLPLHCACQRETPRAAVVDYLLAKYPEAARQTCQAGRYPLHWAVMNDPPHNLVVQVLSANARAIHCADNEGMLPLHHACRSGVTHHLADLLVKRYPHALSRADTEGLLPIHHACRQGGSLELVETLLLEFPGAVQAQDKSGRMALHHACRGGSSSDVISCLFSKYKEAVGKADVDGQLPLHHACRGGAPLPTVVFLVSKYREAGVTPDNMGRLPLHIASRYNGPVVEFLRSKYPTALDSSHPTPQEHALEDPGPTSAQGADFSLASMKLDTTMKSGLFTDASTISSKSTMSGLASAVAKNGFEGRIFGRPGKLSFRNSLSLDMGSISEFSQMSMSTAAKQPISRAEKQRILTEAADFILEFGIDSVSESMPSYVDMETATSASNELMKLGEDSTATGDSKCHVTN